MTIHTASKHLFKLLAALGLIAALAACGGGGSDNKDSTPDAFSFTAVTNSEVNTEVSSAPVSVVGINQSVTVSITGGTYSIAGGAFTNAAGTVSNGQSIIVKVTSSSATNTPVEAVLTVGGVTGNFKVTTKPDVTPDAFSFTAATAVAPNSVSTSSAITVAGIDIAVPISIAGGEYSINDSAFTSTAGTVSKTQTVKVRATASASTSTTTNVVLTVSDKNATYAITTLADTVAPTAQILFPPPVSMTEGNTILVRGTASDDYNVVTSVKVNNVEVTPKAGGDYSTWQISVPLTATIDNSIVVTTEDSAGNKSSTQSQPVAQVMVRQGDYKNAFPDSEVVLDNPQGLVIDTLDGKNRLLLSVDSQSIGSIDLASGKRSVFTSSARSAVLAIEPVTKRLYGMDRSKLFYLDLADATKHDATTFGNYNYIRSFAVDDGPLVPRILALTNDANVLAHDVSSNNYSIFSDANLAIPNTENPIWDGNAIAYDRKNSRYLIADGGQDIDVSKHAILAVDRITGARTILSSNTKGAGDLFTALLPNNNINGLLTMAVDGKNNRAIVGEFLTGKFFFVDLDTGDRKLFSDSSQVDAINPLRYVTSIAIEASGNYIFVADYFKRGVYAVDFVTGQRVIFSKSASTF